MFTNNYPEAGEAVYALMEELYNSSKSIDHERIKDAFSYLCKEFDVNEELLDCELCVSHNSEFVRAKQTSSNEWFDLGATLVRSQAAFK